MKLSEIKSDEAMDILCDITPYISNIIEDKKLIKILKNRVQVTEENEQEVKKQAFELGIKNITKLVPIMFKDHRNDVQMILSIIDGVDIQVIKEESIIKNMARINEMLQDKELIDFFSSFQA